MADAQPQPPDYLKGVIAPMFTPVHADRTLDMEGATAMVEWLVGLRHVRSVFARSGLGKMFTFTVDETKQLGAAIVKAAKGRIGVLLGASGEWLDRDKDRSKKPDSERYLAQAVELTQYARRIGADAAVHVVPEAITPAAGETVSQAVFRYYKTVQDAADIPILLYQPGGILPEYRLTPELLRRLLTLPRFAGMKISTSDDTVFQPLGEVARGTDFALIAGNETYYLRALNLGAVGVIGEGCNVYPQILESVRAHYRNGPNQDATRAQADVKRALALKQGLDSAVIWKQVLIRRGVRIQPYDRSTVSPYSDAVAQRVDTALRALLTPYGA